jgi:hypothetical protein
MTQPIIEAVDARNARIDLLPLPVAMARIAQEKREADRAEKVGGTHASLIPLALALARLAARRHARRVLGHDRD